MTALAKRSPALPDPTLTPQNVGEIAVCMTDLRVRMDAAQERVRAFVDKRHEEYKYDLMELGWLLLRLKAVHQSDHLTQFGAGHGGALPAPPEGEALTPVAGFHGAVQRLWDENLPIRQAQNYMNLARNAGLTAESLRQEVLAKRQAAVLQGRKLQDLYRPPAGEPEEEDDEGSVSREEGLAQLALMDFRRSFSRVTHDLLDKGLVETLPTHELEAMDGQLIELRRRIKARLQAA